MLAVFFQRSDDLVGISFTVAPSTGILSGR